VKREGDDGYGARERERERADDRKRYDEDAVGLLSSRGADTQGEPKSPPKPNFANSGLLAKESNQVKGVALKYHEPPEARKPTQNWRLYVFKGDEQVGEYASALRWNYLEERPHISCAVVHLRWHTGVLVHKSLFSPAPSICFCAASANPDLIHVYRQSCFLVGRDAVVADIHVQHPSCSKQHAVLQFRSISRRNQYGDVASEVKPFIIDLDSTNGTYVNGEEVPKSRYYELRVNDGE
jgi:smad nuclear-interacting protein 1